MAPAEIRPLIRKFDFKASAESSTPLEAKIRKDFPENWIYEDFNNIGLVRKQSRFIF